MNMPRPRAAAIADGLRYFLGVILLLDAARSMRWPDASLLSILVRLPHGVPLPVLDGVLLGAAFLIRHRGSAVVLVAHAALAAANIVEFYWLRAGGLATAPLPYSLLSLVLFSCAAWEAWYSGPVARRAWTVASAAAFAPVLLVLHIFTFGATDYARPADAIVVFGARVYASGAPSLSLADRLDHGVDLYRRGLAPKIVLSGAPDEVPAMERHVLTSGVPADAIVLDPAGVNSYATLANVKERSIIAVSHYYHLARIKLTARRLGLACATSPCPMTRRLWKEPWFIARECAAFLSYYLFR